MTRRTIFLCALVATSTWALPALAAAQSGPTLALDVRSASPGQTVTATGAGFEQIGAVALYLDAVVAGDEVGATALNRGGFALAFAVPPVPPGRHIVIACREPDGRGGCREQATAPLDVVEADRPTTTVTTSTTVRAVEVSTTTSRPAEAARPAVTTTTQRDSVAVPSTTLGGDPPAPSVPGEVVATTVPTPTSLPTGLLEPVAEELPDLSVRAIEITQGIQNLNSAMPLVEGRRTWVRVHPQIDQPYAWFEVVDGALLLQRDGEETVLYPVNGPISAVHSGADRTDPDAALNFELDDDWAAGEVTFTAAVWSLEPATLEGGAEPNPYNNFDTKTRVFHEIDEPTMYMIPLDDGAGPGPSMTIDYFWDAVDQAGLDIVDFHPLADPVMWAINLIQYPGPQTALLDLPDAAPGMWLLQTAWGRTQPLIQLAWLHQYWNMDEADRLFGVFHEDTPSGGFSGWAKSDFLSAWWKPVETTPSHELAHLRGLGHVGCKDDDADGVPDELAGGALDPTYPTAFPNCSLAPVDPDGYYGFTTYRDPFTIYSNDPASPAAAFPLMSYMGTIWSDAYHYCRLLDSYGVTCSPGAIGVPPKFVPHGNVDCNAEPGDGFGLDLCVIDTNEVCDDPPCVDVLDAPGAPPDDVVLVQPDTEDSWVIVSGIVDHEARQGAVMQAMLTDELAPAVRTATAEHLGAVRAGRVPATVMLQAVDASGQVLAAVPAAGIGTAGHGDEHADGSPDPYQSFFQALPWPAGAQSVRLVLGGSTIAERGSTAHPPVVDPDSIVSLAADSNRPRDREISWTASDPDGDPMTYTVFWSSDGEEWLPIGLDLVEPRLTITDEMGLAGGDAVRVRVVANDGLRTGEATGAPFAVPGSPPRISLQGPAFGAEVPRHTTVTFVASPTDAEDGVLDGSGLTWTSDRDGLLGNGRAFSTRELSEGRHRITVSAHDAEGNAATASTEVVVVDDGRPAPRVEGALPDAERLLREGVDTASPMEAPSAESSAGDAGRLALAAIAVSGTAVVAAIGWRRRSRRHSTHAAPS